MSIEHIISTKQFLDLNYLSQFFNLTSELEKLDQTNQLPQVLKNKVIATLFYEPSTRTRLSFEAAAQKLGGMIISTESASHFSSAVKGETIEDTIRIVGGYAQVIVLRHPDEGTAGRAAGVSSVPIINAGDGKGEHPTQALVDLYTINKEKDRIDCLTIALVGDLLNGRTIHSLIYLLSLYKNVKVLLISPLTLKLPSYYVDYLKNHSVSYEEAANLNEYIKEIDVLYMTRVQKERFASLEEYEQLKDYYSIDPKTLQAMKGDAVIMHPLPRVGEIDPTVDNDPRAAYFRQARNGLYVRIALFKQLFDKTKDT